MASPVKSVKRYTYLLRLFTAGNEEDVVQEEHLASRVDYDEKGNVISEIRFSVDGETEEERSFSYTDAGKITEERLSMPADGVEETIHRQYDEKGRLLQRVKLYSGEEGEKSVYEYGESDQPASGIHYNADGEFESAESFLYDEKQNLVRMDQKNEKGEVIASRTFQYNEQGQMVEENELDVKGQLISKTIYEYSESGKPVKMVNMDKSDRLIESFVAAYDEKGNLLERMVRGSHPAVFKYVYDEKGNCLEEEVTDAFGIPVSKSTYEFDEHNRLASDVHYRFDPGRGNREANYGNRYEYEFF